MSVKVMREKLADTRSKVSLAPSDRLRLDACALFGGGGGAAAPPRLFRVSFPSYHYSREMKPRAYDYSATERLSTSAICCEVPAALAPSAAEFDFPVIRRDDIAYDVIGATSKAASFDERAQDGESARGLR